MAIRPNKERVDHPVQRNRKMGPAGNPPGEERAKAAGGCTKSEKQQRDAGQGKGRPGHRLKGRDSRMRQAEQQPSGHRQQVGGAPQAPRCALIHGNELG